MTTDYKKKCKTCGHAARAHSPAFTLNPGCHPMNGKPCPKNCKATRGEVAGR